MTRRGAFLFYSTAALVKSRGYEEARHVLDRPARTENKRKDYTTHAKHQARNLTFDLEYGLTLGCPSSYIAEAPVEQQGPQHRPSRNTMS